MTSTCIQIQWSHAGTVVPECYKDDVESQWKSLKFDPPPSENAWTDGYQISKGDYVPDVYRCAKLHFDPIRGFGPHICEVAYQTFTRLVFLGFFQLATAYAAAPILTINTSKTSFRTRMCLLRAENKFIHFDLIFAKNANFVVDFWRDLENVGSKRALTWGASSVNTP